jgi:hypothetical protein
LAKLLNLSSRVTVFTPFRSQVRSNKHVFRGYDTTSTSAWIQRGMLGDHLGLRGWERTQPEAV